MYLRFLNVQSYEGKHCHGVREASRTVTNCAIHECMLCILIPPATQVQETQS